MRDLAASEQQRRFGRDKRDTLPACCRECGVLFACHGECPKNRFLVAPDGEAGLNYLCAGWKAFFRRADEPIRLIATLMRVGRPASEVMAVLAGRESEWKDALASARRKGPCPCGSGLECVTRARATQTHARSIGSTVVSIVGHACSVTICSGWR
jgi:uncharacterized protein